MGWVIERHIVSSIKLIRPVFRAIEQSSSQSGELLVKGLRGRSLFWLDMATMSRRTTIQTDRIVRASERFVGVLLVSSWHILRTCRTPRTTTASALSTKSSTCYRSGSISWTCRSPYTCSTWRTSSICKTSTEIACDTTI